MKSIKRKVKIKESYLFFMQLNGMNKNNMHRK